MKKKTRQTLEYLVQKANKLKRFGLDNHISETGLGFHVQRGSTDDLFVVEFDLPDEEKRDASLLTLRLFTQHNESFSFPQLNNLLEDTGLSDDFREFLKTARKAYYTFLNGHPEMIKPGFFEEGAHPTRMEIFNVVLNGTIAHTRDTKKHLKYKLWARDDIRESVLLQEFSRIIHILLKWIYQLAEKCEQELKTNNSSDET